MRFHRKLIEFKTLKYWDFLWITVSSSLEVVPFKVILDNWKKHSPVTETVEVLPALPTAPHPVSDIDIIDLSNDRSLKPCLDRNHWSLKNAPKIAVASVIFVWTSARFFTCSFDNWHLPLEKHLQRGAATPKQTLIVPWGMCVLFSTSPCCWCVHTEGWRTLPCETGPQLSLININI